MAKRKSSTFKGIVTFVFLLLLVGAIAGFAVYVKNSITSDNGSGDSQLFYLEIADKKIGSSAYGYKVGAVGDKSLTCNIIAAERDVDIENDFTYSIKADSGLKFTYVADNKLCLFTSAIDVSNFFVVENTNTGICVYSKGDSIPMMLSCIYPESTISYDDSNFDYDTTMFWLTVTLKENTQSFVKVGFSLKRYGDSVSLDVREIIF